MKINGSVGLAVVASLAAVIYRILVLLRRLPCRPRILHLFLQSFIWP